MKKNEITRFDIPETVKTVIETAYQEEIIDRLDILTLGIKFGNDWNKLVDELVNYAYSWHHVSPDKHKNVVTSAEQYWRWRENNKGVKIGNN